MIIVVETKAADLLDDSGQQAGLIYRRLGTVIVFGSLADHEMNQKSLTLQLADAFEIEPERIVLIEEL